MQEMNIKDLQEFKNWLLRYYTYLEAILYTIEDQNTTAASQI